MYVRLLLLLLLLVGAITIFCSRKKQQKIYDFAESYYPSMAAIHNYKTGIIVKNILYNSFSGSYDPDTAIVNYCVVDSLNIFQGDIIIEPFETYKSILKRIPDYQAKFFGRPFKKWSQATIYYTINDSIKHRKSDIKQAIKSWEDATDHLIKFVELNNGSAGLNYAMFTLGKGYASEVGMKGGLQRIYLPYSPDVGNIIHEIGHLIGLWHEHTRNDRNDYVRVNYENMMDSMKNQFAQIIISDTTTLNTEYDYNSVMHYGKYAFTKNNQPTIEPTKDPNAIIGNRAGPSKDDVEGVKKMYNN